jgi:hypothetical protein
MRASDAVINVTPSGRVTGVQSFAEAERPLTAAQRAMLVLKMQAVAHAIQNGFWAAQGRLKVLAVTSNVPVAQAYEIVRGFLKAVTGAALPVGAAPAEVIKNVSNALITLERGFQSRVIPAIESVKAGTLHPDRWFAMATPYVTGIRSILDEIDESSVSALVGKSVDEAIADAKKIGVKIPGALDKTLDALPFIVGAAVLLFVYQLTAPIRAAAALVPRRLSGYNRRSTHGRKRR